MSESIEAFVREFLVTQPEVSDLVDSRVRPSEAGPFDDRPFVMYETSREEQPYSTSGALTLRWVTMAMQCWGDDLRQAGEVAEAIESVIYGLNFQTSSTGRFRIQGIFRESGPDIAALPDHKAAPQAAQGVNKSYRIAFDDNGVQSP